MTWQSHSRYLPKRKENMSYTKTYAKIYSSFSYSRQKLETIPLSFNGYIDILWHIYKMEYYLAIKRERQMDSPNSHMNVSQTYYTKWKNRILFQNVTYCMVPFLLEKFQIQEPRKDQWLPGVGMELGVHIKEQIEEILWNNKVFSVLCQC